MDEQEKEVSYASVVFKAKRNLPVNAENEQDTVYDEVKVQNKTPGENADTKVFFANGKANNTHCNYQLLACLLGIVCVLLVIGVIGVSVYLSTLNNTGDQENITILQAAVDKLRSEKENLTRQYQNLTVRFDNLTVRFDNLTVRFDNLTKSSEKEIRTLTLQLQSQGENFTERIKNMETEWRRENFSRTQWAIAEYCDAAKDEEMKCKVCQHGWLYFMSSCYAINNPESTTGQKNWSEAQIYCENQNSQLVVITSEEEKVFVKENSWKQPNINGYWIGVRVIDGKWKWIGESGLTVPLRHFPALPGHCLTSHETGGRSVKCDTKNGWICKKEAVSGKKKE